MIHRNKVIIIHNIVDRLQCSLIFLFLHEMFVYLSLAIRHSPGRKMHSEPGNQVPTKCLSSDRIFGRIHTMPQVNRASLTKERVFL